MLTTHVFLSGHNSEEVFDFDAMIQVDKTVSRIFMQLFVAHNCVAKTVDVLRHCVHYVGWRPAFKFYNKWVALFGAAICVAIMFIIRWYYALITFIIVLILYKIVDFLKPGE